MIPSHFFDDLPLISADLSMLTFLPAVIPFMVFHNARLSANGEQDFSISQNLLIWSLLILVFLQVFCYRKPRDFLPPLPYASSDLGFKWTLLLTLLHQMYQLLRWPLQYLTSHGRVVGKINFGQLANRIIIILSFGVSIYKNKNIFHRLKETCSIISKQLTYETKHISLLRGSTSQVNNIFVYCTFFCNPKEKDVTRNS